MSVYFIRPLALLAIALAFTTPSAELFAAEPTRVLILVGPSSHPPGTHEVGAGARVMKFCVEHAENVPDIHAHILTAWPDDPGLLAGAATIVFTGDRFPPAEMKDGPRIMADLTKMMDRGCGLVCVHYATGLGANHVLPDGSHPLLDWMGGYFATRCEHHQSVARIYQAAKIEPGDAKHPVLQGWKPFTVHDEPYINNYFGKGGLAKNVTALATSQLPPESPKEEIVAWAATRDDGGRGMGVVMPHFYKNWRVDDLRMLIMNGIVWTAKRDVPAKGVKTPAPNLAQFEPAAVEPPAKKAK